VAVCASCGAENPPGFRFCGSCGAALEAPRGEARETRKTVTVVFCDVTGSTALGERLDPESLRSVMARYFEAMRGVIEHHGGTVEKFIGDAVMAVFGVPVLHEDDALRAVRAAADMREALAELNQELERDFGTTLLVRIGVNTGQVVTGTEERLATGDAVNVAARLEQAAEPGEILVGPETHALVRDAVDAERVQPLELKGKSESLTPFRLLSVVRDAPGHARRFDTSLVGRERELRLLGDAWDRVLTERSCSLFTLLGPAGVGKSRLVAEFLREVDATVVRGRCLSYGEGITYWPVVEVLIQLLDGPASDSGALGVPEAVAARIAALLGEDATPSSPEETAWAVRKVFEAKASEHPVIVVFDDIHWGEATFLDLVEHVVGLSRDVPIFLLCIARPDLLDARPTWAGGLLNATTVLLEPLSIDEAEVLIGQLLGDERLEPGLRARIRETAGGNPLFLEEMLAMLREDGANGDVTVPPTIHALLAARLDQLEPPERSVLESGSIEGEVFHRGAVQALAPTELEVDSRLTTLVRKELVRPDRPALPGEEAYRFRHVLIRDAAYDALPKAVRATLHESFARWLDQHAATLVELDEIVGYHFERAFRYRQELGPVDKAAEALAEQAGERLGRGGTTARARGDVRAAETLLRRAVSLLPEGDSRSLELLLELADALYFGGRLADSRAVLGEAVTLSRRHDDKRFLARARLHEIELAGQTDPTGSAARSLAEAEILLRELERVGDAAGLARAWGLVGRLRFFRGRAAAAEEAYARAIESAGRAENPDLERQTYEWWAGAKCHGPAPVREGLAFIEAVPESALKSAQLVAFLAEVHSSLSAMEGHFDEARAHVARAQRIADEFGLELRGAGLLQFSGNVEVLAGDLRAAEREFRRGYELLHELGETGFRSTTGASLAEVLMAQGRDTEAELIVDEVDEMAQEDDLDPQARTRAVRALLLERRGRHVDATRLAREAVALYGASDYLNAHADMLLTLTTVLRAADHADEARQALEEALALYERKGNLVMVGRVRGLLAELASS
jgi:class 3 adenylate cyclase/tetratricopeptide (TPR) repeat protein